MPKESRKNTGANKKKYHRREAIDLQKPEKKLTGSGFFVMVGLAVTKDILDIIFTFTLIFAIFASFFGIIISFLILFYLIYNDVKWTTRKIVTMLITFIVEFLPFINAFIPAATVNLFIIKKFENSDRFKEFAEKKASLLAKT